MQNDIVKNGVIPIRRLCEDVFGGVSTMWVDRKIADPNSGFPRPIYISGKRFWRLSEVLAWIEAQPTEGDPVGKAAEKKAAAAQREVAA